MAKKEAEPKVTLERTYIIPLRREWLKVPEYKRTNKAVKAIRQFIVRHMKIYEIPREVYKKIPGLKLVEMKRNRNHAWCCGAGGGVKIGYPEWAIEISGERIEEAKDTGATILTSVCPFCRTNLSDANDKYNKELEVLDLLEILDELEIEFQD